MTALSALASLSRQLPPSRGKARVGRVLGMTMAALGFDPVAEVAADDGVFLLDGRSRTEAAKLWNGHYDEDDVAFLRAVTPADGAFLDIGANVGLILIPMLAHLGHHGRAVGVEPMPVNFDRLGRAVARNRPATPVELRQIALGSTTGTLQLVKEGRRGASGNAVPSAADGRPGTEVPVVTLDALTTELALTRLDTIKIDVEGLEVEVFRGAVSTLERFRPLVYGEFNNELMPRLGVDFLDAWAIFEPLGYVCFSFKHRLHLEHRPTPHAALGNVVLAPSERVSVLERQGIQID